MELHEILARIDQRLAAVGLTESAASKQAGKTDAIRNMRRAIKEDDRKGVSTATLNALAPVLGTTSVWLLAGAGPEEPGASSDARDRPDLPTDLGTAIPVAGRTVEVPYGGVIEAGHFREVADYDDVEHEPDYLPSDAEFPGVRQIAYDVRGDSMNALVPRPILNGDRLITLDFEGLGGRIALHNGMVVVVQRSKNGGLLVERSVKQLEVFEDRYEFHPRSTSKKHRPIIVPHNMEAEDGEEVRILAMARYVLNRL